MNLFVTHPAPVHSAIHHCDVHLRKMAVEAAQLLSTAHHVVTGEAVGYKKTHANHPCAIWVRESVGNYRWAYNFYCALLDEYQYRTGKVHGSSKHRDALRRVPPIAKIERTPFAQAMPEQYRGPCAHTAYRRYLRAKLTEWKARARPVRTTFTKRDAPPFLT